MTGQEGYNLNWFGGETTGWIIIGFLAIIGICVVISIIKDLIKEKHNKKFIPADLRAKH